MDTYKINTTSGKSMLYTVSTMQGDLPDEDVIKAARDAGILQEDDQVESVDFWPCYDPEDTKPVTFHLMGRFEIPKGMKEHLDFNGNIAGFEMPDGSILRIQVVMELEKAPIESHEDLSTCDLEALGVVGFGELDEKEIRIDEE